MNHIVPRQANGNGQASVNGRGLARRLMTVAERVGLAADIATGPGAEAKIAASFGTVAMTVADEDMPDLPPLNIVETQLQLPDAVMASYRAMARELFTTAEGRTIEAASPLIATGKLAQMANGFIYGVGNDDAVFVHDLKIEWLRELVESLDGDRHRLRAV